MHPLGLFLSLLFILLVLGFPFVFCLPLGGGLGAGCFGNWKGFVDGQGWLVGGWGRVGIGRWGVACRPLGNREIPQRGVGGLGPWAPWGPKSYAMGAA